jgi:CheY-like chemotaxis protein
MLLTSGARQGDAERSRRLGVGSYLQKPVSRRGLIEAALTAMAQHAPAVPPAAQRSIERAGQALRILLAEDNLVNQQVAVAMLSKRGHTVEIAANGRLAVDAVRERSFDVVLMDLQMPEMDGLAAAAEMRTLPHGCSLHIVAVTANVMSGEKARCLLEGMDGYLAKPFKARELFAAVEGGRTDSGPSLETTLAPPVDLEGFRASLREGGVEEMLGEIVRQFQHDAPSRLAALDLAVGQHNAKAVNRAAHAFKSSAGTIRAGRLETALGAMEAAGRAGNLESAVSLLDAVHAEQAAAISYLHRAVEGNTHGGRGG